jgi:TM2 domain-containing membrane protein YozV
MWPGKINFFAAAWRIYGVNPDAPTGDICVRHTGAPGYSTHEKSIQSNMAKVIQFLPELTGEEMIYVQKLIADYDDEKAKTFATVYRARRKDPQLILILALLGFVGFAGIHRMITDQVGMGILYLLTLGICFIGTIVDLINYQKLALEFNTKQANEVALMI